MIIQPPSTLLIGPPGSGKTTSIATQLLCGLEVFVLMTEPDGVASLLDAAERLKAPVDKLHWAQCLPASSGWMDLKDMVEKINTMDQKGLADLRDLGKAGFRPAAYRFVDTLANFVCERTGKSFGDVTKFDDTCALNIDSLTGWSMIGWGATVGYKPTANPGEWGIAQNFIQNMLIKINTDRKCFFALTAHMEKETDDMTGAKKIMVSTIGAKLAPKVPVFFSEVVLCSKRPDKGWRWSTIDSQMDLKNRALPSSADLDPDFKPIVDAYRRRKKLAEASLPTPQPTAQGTVGPVVVPPAAARA